MNQWWKQKVMKINELKSGILRILKRTRKIGIIPNKLNTLEVNQYKYLGIMLNQSIRAKYPPTIHKRQNKIPQEKNMFTKTIAC